MLWIGLLVFFSVGDVIEAKNLVHRPDGSDIKSAIVNSGDHLGVKLDQIVDALQYGNQKVRNMTFWAPKSLTLKYYS